MHAVGIEHLHLRAGIPGVIHKEPSACKREGLDGSITFRHDFAPVLTRRIPEVRGEYPSIGGFPVGVQKDLIASNLSEKPGGDIVDERANGPLLFKVLVVNLRPVGR